MLILRRLAARSWQSQPRGSHEHAAYFVPSAFAFGNHGQAPTLFLPHAKTAERFFEFFAVEVGRHDDCLAGAPSAARAGPSVNQNWSRRCGDGWTSRPI